ncbi:Aste57867_16507 [Aphanomyces stellatus]|uniref:Aste57867_16507 protein n=1 Tax=Aphanomyces stellatus TaxID=120398 RepID=A0A485L6F1_9STRA|nr:hypothetical protein As57867_016450 [Aphanomyces stellatus]VFT93281.1 Aste57867_16507 [Aphanomyces stellatus]
MLPAVHSARRALSSSMYRPSGSRFGQLALLHLGRATEAGTEAFLSKGAIESDAAIRFNKSVVRIAPLGYGSPAAFTKDTQVLADIKEAVLTHRNNFIQTHFVYSDAPSGDDKLGRVGEAIALNELLTEEDVPREALVLSALLDNALGRAGLSTEARLAPDVLRNHVQQILHLLDVQVLDLIVVRLPSDLFSMSTADASALVRGAIAGLQRCVDANLVQGFGFAFPSDIVLDVHALDVLAPHLPRDCVVLQRPVNIQQGSAVVLAQPAHVTWIGESPLDIFVDVHGRRKPLHLESAVDALEGGDVAAKLKEAFGFALNVEEKYRNSIHTDALPSPDDVAWAHILAHQHGQFDNWAEWEYIRETQIHPRVQRILEQLQAIDATKDFAFAYSVAIRNLLRHFDVSIEMIAANQNAAVHQQLRALDVDAASVEEAAMRVARSCPVDCVLFSQNLPKVRGSALERVTPETLAVVHSQSWHQDD